MEDWTLWVGQNGLPPHLNKVLINPPRNALSEEEISAIDNLVFLYTNQADDANMFQTWYQALVLARHCRPDIF